MSTPKRQNKAQLVFGFVSLALLLLLGYLVIVTVWDALSDSPAVRAGIVAATLTGLLAIASTFITKYLDRKATVLAQLREKKIPVYENIIRLVFSIVFAGKGGKPKIDEQEMIKSMADITEKLTIWGSDEMVHEYFNFRMSSLKQASGDLQNPHDILRAVTDLMLAVRIDLGHKNKDISRQEILGLFVNDVPKDFT